MASYFDEFDPERARQATTPHDFGPELAAGVPVPEQNWDEQHPVDQEEVQQRLWRQQPGQVDNPGEAPQDRPFPAPAIPAPSAPPPSGPPPLADGIPMDPNEQVMHQIMNGINQATLGTARTRQLQRLQNGQATVDDLVMNGTLGPVEAEQYRQMIARQMEPLMVRQSQLPILMQRLQYQRLRMQAAHETALGVENERFRATTAQGRMPSAQAADGSTWVQSGNGTWHQARPEQRPQGQMNEQQITQNLRTHRTEINQEMERALRHRHQSEQDLRRDTNLDATQRAAALANLPSGVPAWLATARSNDPRYGDPAHPNLDRDLIEAEALRRHQADMGRVQGNRPGGNQPPPPMPTPGQPGAPQAQQPIAQGGQQRPAPIPAVEDFRQQARGIPGGEILARPIDEFEALVRQYATVPRSQIPPAALQRWNQLREFIPNALRRQRRNTPARNTPSGLSVAEMPMF